MDLTELGNDQLATLLHLLTACNDDKLAELHHTAHDSVEAMEKQLQESAPYVTAKQTIKAIEDILTQRLHDSGANAINTPHGTIHTVGKTTAKIMDPEAFRGFIIETRAWDMLDWKANMTACRAFLDEEKIPVPGVELSTYRRLSITAPKTQMKRLINE